VKAAHPIAYSSKHAAVNVSNAKKNLDDVVKCKNNHSRGVAGRMGGSPDTSSEGGSAADSESMTIESVDHGSVRETIAIIGSGDFGRALAGRMVKAGNYNVIIGSREPERNM
jgi:hypothetical protein